MYVCFWKMKNKKEGKNQLNIDILIVNNLYLCHFEDDFIYAWENSVNKRKVSSNNADAVMAK